MQLSNKFRVSEPACIGPVPAPGKREHNVGIFLHCLTVLTHVKVEHICHNLCLL